MIGSALFAFLGGDTTVGSMITTGGIVRVFPHIIPQRSKTAAALVPCVVYTITGRQRQKGYCETSRLVSSSVSLDSYATTFAVAEALASAVRALLIDYRGNMGGVLEVRDVTIDNEMSLEDTEPGLFRVVQMYTFWHEEY